MFEIINILFGKNNIFLDEIRKQQGKVHRLECLAQPVDKHDRLFQMFAGVFF